MDILNMKDSKAITWEAVSQQIAGALGGKYVNIFKLYDNLKELGADCESAQNITEAIRKIYDSKIL